MEKISSRLCGVICAVILLLNSCGKDDPSPAANSTDPVVTEKGTPQGTSTSASIGAAGGTLQSSDERVSVTIPAGALSSNTTISIQPISNNGPLGLGLGYRLEPEGTTFAQPVTISFKYDDGLLLDSNEDFLWIITQANDGSWNAMLKSEVNKTTKTVTVESTHFSDWALGRFIDLTLEPVKRTVLKNQTVNLKISGFIRDQKNEELDELAPLRTIVDDGLDYLAPLTPIPPVESRQMQFRVKSWSLNGTSAPTSGSSGSLTASNMTAVYKAPDKRPSRNPVAVSVNLESSNKEGSKSSYMLTSNITVIENEQFITVRVDGQTYEYYQWGFNGSVPPDPNDLEIANCGYDEDTKVLTLGGGHYINGSDQVSAFALAVENPAESSYKLKCMYDDGVDDATFQLGSKIYNLNRFVRTKDNDNCDTEMTCGDVNVTIFMYEDKQFGNVRGFFSGTIYEETSDVEDNCESSIPHTIDGEFWLSRAN